MDTAQGGGNDGIHRTPPAVALPAWRSVLFVRNLGVVVASIAHRYRIVSTHPADVGGQGRGRQVPNES
jgi:hypothetical protein